MKYIGLEKTSLVNGEGIRCVLWVSGCNHHCRNCQNPDTWDPDKGQEFDASALTKIFDRVEKDYCSGLTLSGGDPMYPPNRRTIYALVKMFRRKFGDTKSIWMYTGYTFDEIANDPILDYIDVIVDGPYIEEQRNTNRKWCGSENQRIWRKTNGTWMMEEPEYADTIE